MKGISLVDGINVCSERYESRVELSVIYRYVETINFYDGDPYQFS